MLDGLVGMLPSKELCSAIGKVAPRIRKEIQKEKLLPKELVPKESVLYNILYEDEDDEEKNEEKIVDVTDKK